jgi:hypothetical protein
VRAITVPARISPKRSPRNPPPRNRASPNLGS